MSIYDKQLFLYQGCSFYMKARLSVGQRWVCTKYRCGAYVHLDEDLNVIRRLNKEHNHPPYRYKITSDGLYKLFHKRKGPEMEYESHVN
ncbi:FLYWCH zinc finger domain-containing protein [Phthorimaea operculella]|nr:FLYWCH zinc finger domain-containing protein [Phthorimaea operculella]